LPTPVSSRSARSSISTYESHAVRLPL
jgi:hypothetical protein